MIKSSPQEIIANGTDWRFVNELKRELKTWRAMDAPLLREGEPHADDPEPPPFPRQRHGSRRRRPDWQSDTGAGRAAAGDDHCPPRAVGRRRLLLGIHVPCRRTPARRRHDRRPVRAGRPEFFDNSEWLAAGETDFDFNMPTMHIRRRRGGSARQDPRRRAFRLLGVARQRSRQQRCRPEGQAGGRLGDERPPAGVSPAADQLCRARSQPRCRVGGRRSMPMQNFIDGKVDAFLVDHQPVLRGSCQEDRPHGLQQPGRPSLVAVFLLHGRRPDADYVDKYPVATKRVLRAILKSAEFCVSNPTAAARAAGRSRLSAELRRCA